MLPYTDKSTDSTFFTCHDHNTTYDSRLYADSCAYDNDSPLLLYDHPFCQAEAITYFGDLALFGPRRLVKLPVPTDPGCWTEWLTVRSGVSTDYISIIRYSNKQPCIRLGYFGLVTTVQMVSMYTTLAIGLHIIYMYADSLRPGAPCSVCKVCPAAFEWPLTIQLQAGPVGKHQGPAVMADTRNPSTGWWVSADRPTFIGSVPPEFAIAL